MKVSALMTRCKDGVPSDKAILMEERFHPFNTICRFCGKVMDRGNNICDDCIDREDEKVSVDQFPFFDEHERHAEDIIIDEWNREIDQQNKIQKQLEKREKRENNQKRRNIPC